MKAFRRGSILASALIGPALFFGLMAFNRSEQLAQINKILDTDSILDTGGEVRSAPPSAVPPPAVLSPVPVPTPAPTPIKRKRPLWTRLRREFLKPLLAPLINLTAFNAIPRQSQIQWMAFQNSRVLKKESAAFPSSPAPSVKKQFEERLGKLRAPRPPQ